jgi:hypothetical protein
VRERAKRDGDAVTASWKVHICSINNFPTAAGLASSAAGYACLGNWSLAIFDLKFVTAIIKQFLHWPKFLESKETSRTLQDEAPAALAEAYSEASYVGTWENYYLARTQLPHKLFPLTTGPK